MSGFERGSHIPNTSEPSVLEGYLVDASNISGHCEVLYRPRDAQDISTILKESTSYKKSVTITAQRTSTTGAPVPHGGVLISMENINKIHSESVVDAGVILGQYQAYLDASGLLFPPDPTSKHSCSMGGAISCNASGARSFRYGSIRNWVEALEVVLPNGNIWQIDRDTPIPEDWPTIKWDIPKVKTAAGYEPRTTLLDLMIGQEGTLGVITKAWLSTIDAPSIIGMMVFFDSRADCLRAVKRLRQPLNFANSSWLPLSLEYFDCAAIGFMQDRVDGIPTANCGLFLELDSTSGQFPHLEGYIDLLRSCGSNMDYAILADNDLENGRLKRARHAIPSGINELVVANRMPKLGTDFSVPEQHLEWMMDAYEEDEIPSVLFGHIGNSHLHLNMLPRNEHELSLAKDIYVELARIALSYGGSVSAEHGIGKIKKSLLAEMVGEETLQQFRDLKSTVDPAWILGRGTLFDRVL